MSASPGSNLLPIGLFCWQATCPSCLLYVPLLAEVNNTRRRKEQAVTQVISDRFWQAEARSEETKRSVRDIKRITRRKFTAEEKIRTEFSNGGS